MLGGEASSLSASLLPTAAPKARGQGSFARAAVLLLGAILLGTAAVSLSAAPGRIALVDTSLPPPGGGAGALTNVRALQLPGQRVGRAMGHLGNGLLIGSYAGPAAVAAVALEADCAAGGCICTGGGAGAPPSWEALRLDLSLIHISEPTRPY